MLLLLARPFDLKNVMKTRMIKVAKGMALIVVGMPKCWPFKRSYFKSDVILG